jgi:hypothetical protein
MSVIVMIPILITLFNYILASFEGEILDEVPSGNAMQVFII